MSYVRDTWTSENLDWKRDSGKAKRLRNDRWGNGKRWQAGLDGARPRGRAEGKAKDTKAGYAASWKHTEPRWGQSPLWPARTSIAPSSPGGRRA